MRVRRSVRRLAGFALLALLAVAAPAEAHAWLLSSEPAANSHVEEAPRAVVLRFTENVEQEYTGATVEDLEGNRVDDGRVFFYPGGQRNEIIVGLQEIQDGIYAVKWRTLSVDTHTASGSLLFAVGNASLEGVSVPEAGHEHGADDPGFWTESLARGVFYAGVASAVGVPLFLLAVWPAAASRDEHRVRRVLIPTLLVVAVGAVAGLMVLGSFADRIGSDLASAATETLTGKYLAGRSLFLFLAAGALALRAWLPAARKGRPAPYLAAALAFGLVAALSTSLSSHAASVRGKGNLPFLGDLVHVLGGSVWLGGLFAFAMVLPGLSAPAAGRLVRRFSPLAMGAVAAILGTGIYEGLLHVHTTADLTGTLYGQAILVKATLLLVLLGFGAWNQFRLGPRLRANAARPRALRGSVAAEAGLLAIVLLAAGVLSTTVPPDTGAAGAPAGTERFEKALDELHLVVDITPSPVRVGLQNLTVTLHAMKSDRPVPESAEVFLKFQPPASSEPDEVITPEKKGTNTWFLRDDLFTQRGNWTLYVIVQAYDYDKVPFQVNVQ